MNPRVLLALEFSSDRRSVAVLREGAVVSEAVQEEGRSTRVLALIDDALAQAGVATADVEALAVGIGPGSYTGIRLAISVAQGWSLATGEARSIPVIPVGSFDVLAAASTGPALLASDAQRDEWAVARVDAGRVVEPVRLVPTAELRALAATARVVGPEVVRALGIGEERHSTAGGVARWALEHPTAVPAEALAPVYLRSAAFVKAPVARVIPGITDVPEP